MTKEPPEDKGLPQYGDPPVVEVGCGIVFEALPQLKAPHLGLLWDKIRTTYPKCNHAPPIGNFITDSVGLPWPRIWFVDEEGNHLIQVQPNRLHFNWRKMGEDEEYPTYKTVIASFKDIFELFSGFVSEFSLGPLNPMECELVYVNHIPKGTAWNSVADMNNIFPDLTWRSDTDRFLDEPSNITWSANFQLPDDKGTLRATLREMTRPIDKLPILRFELTTRGLGEDKSMNAIWDWFELAHEWIVLGFSDLTDVKTQTDIWKRL